MQARVLLLSAACLGTLLLTAAAPAATLTADRACYRADQPMLLTASGFPAGATIGVLGNGQPLAASYLDPGQATGDGTLRVPAPGNAGAGQRPWVLTAESSEQGLDPVPVNTIAKTTVQVIDAFGVAMRPRTASPRAMVTYTATGATELVPLYLHIEVRSVGNRLLSRRTIRLGTPKGPCGTLKVRMRRLGTARPRTGYHRLTVDQVAGGDRAPDAGRAIAVLDTVYVAPKVKRRPASSPPPGTVIGVS